MTGRDSARRHGADEDAIPRNGGIKGSMSDGHFRGL